MHSCEEFRLEYNATELRLGAPGTPPRLYFCISVLSGIRAGWNNGTSGWEAGTLTVTRGIHRVICRIKVISVFRGMRFMQQDNANISHVKAAGFANRVQDFETCSRTDENLGIVEEWKNDSYERDSANGNRTFISVGKKVLTFFCRFNWNVPNFIVARTI